jgi:hypothetical protein
MTRKERREHLSAMWGNMPLTQSGISDEGKFFAWQGRVAALLRFNPQLQSEFRDTIKDPPTYIISPESTKYKPMYDRIRTILAQAMEELSIPEQPTERRIMRLSESR